MVKRSKTVPLQVRISAEVDQALRDTAEEWRRAGASGTGYGLLSMVVEVLLRKELCLPPLKKEG
jgi:hypothetical protein